MIEEWIEFIQGKISCESLGGNGLNHFKPSFLFSEGVEREYGLKWVFPDGRLSSTTFRVFQSINFVVHYHFQFQREVLRNMPPN